MEKKQREEKRGRKQEVCVCDGRNVKWDGCWWDCKKRMSRQAEAEVSAKWLEKRGGRERTWYFGTLWMGWRKRGKERKRNKTGTERKRVRGMKEQKMGGWTWKVEERKKALLWTRNHHTRGNGWWVKRKDTDTLLLLVQRTGFTTLRPQVTLPLSLSNSLLSPHLFTPSLVLSLPLHNDLLLLSDHVSIRSPEGDQLRGKRKVKRRGKKKIEKREK